MLSFFNVSIALCRLFSVLNDYLAVDIIDWAYFRPVDRCVSLPFFLVIYLALSDSPEGLSAGLEVYFDSWLD